MRIAMFHWGFPPIVGGVETHLTMLCPELVRRGHKVSLLTSTVEGLKGSGPEDYKGVRIKRTPLMDLNWFSKRGLENIEDVVKKDFINFIEENRPDIIHAHNMHYFSRGHTITLEGLAKNKGIPLVLTAHNVWDDILYLDLTLDIAWDAVIAVSEFIAKELTSAGLPREKITVVHHGIDTKEFFPGKAGEILKKYPVLKNKRIFFHPARTGLSKGSDISVKALRIIKKVIPDALLILAGTRRIIDWNASQHKDLAYIVQLVKRFGLEENTFMEVFTRAEMPQLYQASDFAIYPSSVGEPFGLTMLEAMACARPMVVTNSGGMPEIIKDGVNGFVIKIRDYKALADRCITLFQDEALKNSLGARGRELAEEKYTKEIMAENTLAVYQKVLGKKR